MSVADVIENARTWLAALAAKEAAENDFRAGTQMEGMVSTYAKWCEAIRVEKVAAHAHLASVIDLPNDGVADDERIARLRAENIRLVEQVRKLKKEFTEARKNNEERNRELDALHYIWCNGGCHGGAHRYCGSPDDITEEIVAAAERNTTRLRQWFINRQHRKASSTTS